MTDPVLTALRIEATVSPNIPATAISTPPIAVVSPKLESNVTQTGVTSVSMVTPFDTLVPNVPGVQ